MTEQEKTEYSLKKLAEAERQGTSASNAAKSVLLYAWDGDHPIVEFYNLDAKNRSAAIHIMDRPWAIEHRDIEAAAPEINQWYQEWMEKRND